MILSFRTLLRKSNIVPDVIGKLNHVVKRRDVVVFDWGVMITVHSTKTLQCQEYVLEIPVYYVSNCAFCVASALREHMVRYPASMDGPLFLKRVGDQCLPVLYKELLCFIKRAVSSIGLPPQEYGTHSMRRAGAGFLHGIGIPLEDIMAMGDWHSLAVLDYLITPVSRKKDIQAMVVQSHMFD